MKGRTCFGIQSLGSRYDDEINRAQLVVRRVVRFNLVENMSSSRENTKRFRPRWSVRILLIAITLICAYLACWGPTKRQGAEDVAKYLHLGNSHYICSAEMPLVVGAEAEIYGYVPVRGRRYYFWFFGYVAKLPYERDVSVEFEMTYDEE